METQSPEDSRYDTEQAALWLERIERTLRADEIADLRVWLKRRAHREIIVERCRLWHGPEILAFLSELISITPPLSRARPAGGRITFALFLAVSGLGLSTLLLAGSRLWSSSDLHQNPLRAETSYRTAIGELREILLPDGSSMTLNTSSDVLVSYGVRSRDITLLRGEASFHVLEDAGRPFHVHAGLRHFTIGAAQSEFSLRKQPDDRLEIVVTAGQVTALDSSHALPLTAAQLRLRPDLGAHTFSASEGGVLGAGWQSTNPLSAPEIHTRLAWQRGVVMFSNERLEDAILEFNRYTTARFVLLGEVGQLRLSAQVAIGDVEAFLDLLHKELQLDARRDAQGRIVLSSGS